jgi:hypothetical protein
MTSRPIASAMSLTALSALFGAVESRSGTLAANCAGYQLTASPSLRDPLPMWY